MKEIFRFIKHRVPEASAEIAPLGEDLKTDFSKQLLDLKQQGRGLDDMRKLIHEMIHHGYLMRFPKENKPFHHHLCHLYHHLEDHALSASEMSQQLQEAFGMSLQDFVKSDQFSKLKERYYDHVVAKKLAPRLFQQWGTMFVRNFKLLCFLQTVVEEDSTEFQAFRKKAIVMPKGLLPLSRKTRAERPKPGKDEKYERAKKLEAENAALEEALGQAFYWGAESFVSPERKPSGENEPVATKCRGVLQKMGCWLGVGAAHPMQTANSLGEGSRSDRKLKAETFKQLPEVAKSYLEEVGIVAENATDEYIVRMLEKRVAKNAAELAGLTYSKTVKVGSKYYSTSAFKSSPSSSGASIQKLSSSATLPTGSGEVTSVGFGDLLVVKEQIKRYEAGEIAHIENVLKGEAKERTHRRLKRTEESFLVETEETQTEEREHESTERFEMQQESEKVLQQDKEFSAGASVTAQFGPFVEASASVDGSLSTSKETSEKHAASYSKSVTDRASSSITKRVREEQIRKVIIETEETNSHELNNVGGSQHTVGVYQWIDKIYESQVYRYGLRQLFDLTVTEPASFYIHSQESAAVIDDIDPPPVEFTLQPDGLNRTNYHQWVKAYGVTGVEPPPPVYQSLALSFDDRSGDGQPKTDTKTATLQVPDGYELHEVVWGAFTRYLTSDSNSRSVRLRVSATERVENSGGNEGSMDFSGLSSLRGEIPVNVFTFRVIDYVVSVRGKCKLTDEGFEEWQLNTYDKIQSKYQELKDAYDGQAVSAGIVISGKNPALNALIARNELKKSALSVLTDQHFDLFDSVQTSVEGYPEIDIDEATAEGAYIRFFEQAFEWEHMMYLYYPYFWGRKPFWVDKINMEDVDTDFQDFLKAGAARLVVSVRPGFEAAVQHYLETGEIWNGIDPLEIDVSSELYLPIVEELMAQDDALLEEEPVHEPWDVRVPTSLVRLRNTSELPTWEKDADGTWLPVPESSDEVVGPTPGASSSGDSGDGTSTEETHTH